MNAKSVTILSLDSATSGCSVCVWRDGRVLASGCQDMARGQAEALMPMVQEALRAADVATGDLDAIAVTRGPGAFTGLRIALAAARGLALALEIPCVGVTTLEVLAHGVPDAERQGRRVLACVESRRADIYAQLFAADLQPLSEPLAADGAALAGLVRGGGAVVVVGDAAARALDMLAEATVASGVEATLSTAPQLPDAALIAVLAATRIKGAAIPQPLYLRPPDAKLPKVQGRARV